MWGQDSLAAVADICFDANQIRFLTHQRHLPAWLESGIYMNANGGADTWKVTNVLGILYNILVPAMPMISSSLVKYQAPLTWPFSKMYPLHKR